MTKTLQTKLERLGRSWARDDEETFRDRREVEDYWLANGSGSDEVRALLRDAGIETDGTTYREAADIAVAACWRALPKNRITA